jgi:hypothetical protein
MLKVIGRLRAAPAPFFDKCEFLANIHKVNQSL